MCRTEVNQFRLVCRRGAVRRACNRCRIQHRTYACNLRRFRICACTAADIQRSRRCFSCLIIIGSCCRFGCQADRFFAVCRRVLCAHFHRIKRYVFIRCKGEVFTITFDTQVFARRKGYFIACGNAFGCCFVIGFIRICNLCICVGRFSHPFRRIDRLCHSVNRSQLAFFRICNTHLAGFFGFIGSCNRFYCSCNSLHCAVCADSDCFIVGIDLNAA